MKTELKIIKLFIKNKTSITIREIAKQINADYRITHTAAQRLIRKDILKAKNVGKSMLCSLNIFYYGIEICQAESERVCV
jgi:predicted DNA-binding transcriptional regulator